AMAASPAASASSASAPRCSRSCSTSWACRTSDPVPPFHPESPAPRGAFRVRVPRTSPGGAVESGRMGTRPRFRWAWWLLAYASLGLGIVGVFVPGMPTTVFILVSAYAAARGSDRLHAWLLAHPRFGPLIRDWRAHGAVSRRAKWMATATMLACAVVLIAV